MILKSFYITEEQDKALRKLGKITVSEHIRRAIDDYIEKKEKEQLKISFSKS